MARPTAHRLPRRLTLLLPALMVVAATTDAGAKATVSDAKGTADNAKATVDSANTRAAGYAGSDDVPPPEATVP